MMIAALHLSLEAAPEGYLRERTALTADTVARLLADPSPWRSGEAEAPGPYLLGNHGLEDLRQNPRAASVVCVEPRSGYPSRTFLTLNNSLSLSVPNDYLLEVTR